MKRRYFLQGAGGALGAIALSQWDLARQGDRLNRVLAQPTSRKLALLVGINRYPLGIAPLRGCVTDMEMQRELLVHRFGFNPQDILTLSDENASRANLLDAFESHLIDQAQPGDVVVFHFSGHGALVRDPDPIPLPRDPRYQGVQGYNGTMVPYDGRLGSNPNLVNDIMGKTLFLLMSALKTDQVTVMLDSCHSGGGTRGDLRFRAIETRFGDGYPDPSEQELMTQETWMSRLDLSAAELKQQRSQGIAKGVAVGSAQANQLAADASFGRGAGRFFAGAFTYGVTRYLWQQPGNLPLQRVFVDLSRSARDVANSSGIQQAPVFAVAPGSDHDQKPLYFLTPQTPPAEAVVLGEENGEISFWLGGVSSQSLEAFEEGTVFAAIDAQGQELAQIEQTRREGLRGYGIVQGEARSLPQAGRLLRERVRGVPPELSLRLGLDSSLEDDLNEMRSLLGQIRQVDPVPLDGGETPHFLIGRMTRTAQALAVEHGSRDISQLGSIGLFTRGLVPIPQSFGQPNESIAAAANRLVPRFQLLLAGQILGSVLNSDTSNLNLEVQVEVAQNNQTLARSGTRSSRDVVVQQRDHDLNRLPSGSEVLIEVTNHEDRDLYVSLLAIGSSGRITVLYPNDWDAPEQAARLASGQSLIAPEHEGGRNPQRNYCTNPSGDFHLCLTGRGYVEILTIASTRPLRDALRAIARIAGETGLPSRSPLALRDEDSLNVVKALLTDMNRYSRGDIEVRTARNAVNVNQMAALSTMIEIVDP
jgi:hypothetical protein